MTSRSAKVLLQVELVVLHGCVWECLEDVSEKAYINLLVNVVLVAQQLTTKCLPDTLCMLIGFSLMCFLERSL